MKKILVLFPILLFCMHPAFAISPDEVMRNMQTAADTTVANYRKGGISLLSQNSERCYKDVLKYRFYCIYLDLAARHVSDRDGAGVKFAPDKYFVDDAFLPRAGGIFIRSNMSKDESNEYLSIVTPIINKLVDDALTGQ